MAEETNNIDNHQLGSEPYVVSPDSIKTTYHHYGKQAARNLNSNSKNLGAALANIYNQFLIDQELNEEGISQRVKRLHGEVLQKQNQKVQLNAEIETLAQFKEAKEKKIEELEVEKIKVRSGEAGSSDILPFSIGVLIVILLTLYLIVFYSSTGYSAFYGVSPGSLGFINPNVFTEAINKGGGVIALIVLFPVIFLGLGFLIHDSLEHKKYAIIIGLLFFTFLTDAIIGYKIAQAIHNNEYNAALVNTQWQFEMIYSDINFYLVLALGFVVYVIWGGLLNYVLNKFRDIQPDRATELRTENLDRKINEHRMELVESVTKGNVLKSQVAILQNEIVDKEKDVIGYLNGLIPVNVSQLKASIGDFMLGWYAYTNLMFPHDANQRCQEAREVQEAWLQEKINSLN